LICSDDGLRCATGAAMEYELSAVVDIVDPAASSDNSEGADAVLKTPFGPATTERYRSVNPISGLA
jgi:hypothetical protein